MKKRSTQIRIIILSIFLTLSGLFVHAQTPPSDLNGEDLKSWLRTNYFDGKHQTLGYSTARMYLYNYIDNENNVITCVYSGYQVNSNYGGTTTYPAPINCEHTIPQSYFSEAEPMKSDIHHLYPTYENWNSTRSNYPFTEIDDNSTAKWMYLNQSQTSVPSSNIDLYSEYASSTFEPREDHKGNVARAVFYFYTMYPTQAGDITRVGDVDMFYQWHLADPVDAEEIERNGEIETYQGNRNPFVDHPDLVARAWNFTQVNTPPSSTTLQLSATTSSINLSWSNVANETGYKIYKSTDGTNFSLLTSPSANVTSYSDNAVVANTTYYYYIVAYNDYGNSSNSNTVNGQLSSGNTGSGISVSEALAQPIGTSITVDGIITESFNGIYALVMKDINSTETIVVKLETDQRAEWSPENNPSVIGKTIEVVGVRDTYSSQPSIESVSSIKEIGGNPADTEAPTVPTNLATTNITETTVTLSWTASTDNVAVTGYDIYKDGNLLISTSNTTYNVTGLIASTSYSFYVKAKDEAGNTSNASNTINITTIAAPDTEAPTAPSNLAATNITETTVTLNWTASTDNVAVTGYDIYKDGSLLTSTTNTTYNVSGLTESTSYSFYVKAKDEAGNTSNASNTINIATDVALDTEAPSAPSNLAATNITETTATLSWTASTDNVAVTGYDIYKDGSLLTSTTINTYSVTGLTESTSYTFYVKAKDEAGNISNASNSINITTLSGTPTSTISVSEALSLSVGTSVIVEGIITESYNGVYALVMKDVTNTETIVVKLEADQRTQWSPENNPSIIGTTIEVVGKRDEYSSLPSIEYVTSITEIAAPVDTEAPTVPTNLTSSNITETTVNLAWNASTDNVGVTAYKLYKDGSLLTTLSSTTYNVTGLTESTTYNFYVTAEDAAGNVSSASSSLSVTTLTPAPVGDVELVYSTFEDGWGIWTSGGKDCLLYTSSTRAWEGTNAANIQDNSGVSSSFYLTNGIDVHSDEFNQIEVSFYFYAYSMDNSNEDFWLQYYDGSSWNTVETYAKSIDFDNNTFYSATVYINESQYNFPTNMKLRFMCDASGNADDVYIDNIKIVGKKTSQKSGNGNVLTKLHTIEDNESEIELDEISVYPNPAIDFTSFEVVCGEATEINYRIVDTQGRTMILKENIQVDEYHKENIDVSKLNAGVYFILIANKNTSESYKLIIQ